jgi:hypothetical protein
MLIDNLLKDNEALQLYLKTTKGWNSYSSQFLNFSLSSLLTANSIIPFHDSPNTKKVLFIGIFYGIIPSTYSSTLFYTGLNGIGTSFNLIPSNNPITNCLPLSIKIPVIMDGINIISSENASNYNFQGYMFYSN